MQIKLSLIKSQRALPEIVSILNNINCIFHAIEDRIFICFNIILVARKKLYGNVLPADESLKINTKM